MSTAARTELPGAENIGAQSATQQLGFYFQFIFRFVFGLLAFLYIRHFGIADGLMPYEMAVLFVFGYVLITAVIMFLSFIPRLVLPARNGLLVLDLSTLAFGMPFDPNPGLPLMSTVYLGFLDTGLRYGARLYLRQIIAAVIAMGIMFYLREFHTVNGFTALDAWHVVLFFSIILYGLQVFTMRERAAGALRETQQRLQLSLEAPGVAMWSSDAPLRTLRSEGNLERILGVPPEEFSGRMADFIAQIHPDDRERVVAQYNAFLQGPAGEYDCEHRLQGLDGVLRTVNVRARAQRDASGQAVGVSGMAWDLTEYRQQQQALLRMEERYRLATSSARVGVWLWNVENGEFEIDESLKTLFGLSARDVGTANLRLRQADFFALIHPDDRLAHARYLRSLLTSGEKEYYNEFRIAPPGGAVLDIQARGTVFRNEQGKLLTVVGVAWDATQLMETRRALEAKTAALVKMDQRYRLATHSARVGAWIWDIPGARFEIDASMAAVFGFSPPADRNATARIITMTDFMERVHPEDRARVNDEGISALKSDTREYFQEYRIRLDDGEVRGIQSRGSMYRKAGGRAVQAAGVVWDATELMEARSALERRTLELQRANQELDDFSYMSSHDLKEPLRGIGNYARYLLEDYAGNLDEKGRDMLLKMREQAKRMETVITELLHVARIGRSALEIEDTDLGDVVGEILASLEFSIQEKHLQIRQPQPLPVLRCDRVRVAELMRNLITNGMKYNDKPEPWIEIGHRPNGSAPVFYVRDNGIGISSEHQHQVFGMFQRLHPRGAYGGGSGVGLTIARKIVEMHGGRIWIESEPGIGSTFYFTLPAEALA